MPDAEELYVHEVGAGPALVLAHGSAADAETWPPASRVGKPLAAADDQAPVPAAFRDEPMRRYRDDGGEAAAELFLRTVLGDASFDRMPAAWRARALGLHRQISLDVDAVIASAPRFSELGAIATPILLLGAARRPTSRRCSTRSKPPCPAPGGAPCRAPDT